MTEYPVTEVRQNNTNGQKLLTVPKESNIEQGDKVRLVKLGSNWDMIPGYLKAHQNIRDLVSLTVRASEPLDRKEFEEIDAHLEEAGEALSQALDFIEDKRTVYADISTEELQEKCGHEDLTKEEDGEWRCVNCKKALMLS